MLIYSMASASLSSSTEQAALLPRHDRTAWLKGGEHPCLMPPRKAAGQVWRVVLLGAPGVGKGTQAELLCDRLGFCHLSTGDVFRAAKRACEHDLSPAMLNALEYMHRGELVPDETVLNMVGERLHCLQCSGGFLLDGFPRTVAQAKALEQQLDSNDIQINAVFNYDLPTDKIVARIAGRRTCSNCKTVYHLSSRPSKIADLCDRCGGRLFQREDDRPEAAKVRMDAYENSTRPLIEFYRQRGLLLTIAADGTPGEILQRTLSAAGVV